MWRCVLAVVAVVGLSSIADGAGSADVLLDLDLSRPPAARDASALGQRVQGVRGKENFVETDRGNAYWFDGLTDQLVVDASQGLAQAFRRPFTVEVEFLYHVLPEVPRCYPRLVAGVDGQGKPVWELMGFKYNSRCRFYSAPDMSLLFGVGPKPLEWHRAAICYDGKEVVGYWDGVQGRERVSWAGADRPCAKIVIGQLGRSKWDRFSGLIRRVKITRGVLFSKATSDEAKRTNSDLLRAKSLDEFSPLLKPEDRAWAQRHPFMLFTWDEIPALKQRLASGRGPELLRHFRDDCDAALDPASPRYVPTDTRLGLFQDRYWPGCNMALLPLATILFGEERYVRHGIELMLTTARTVGYYDIAEKEDASFADGAGTAMNLALGYDWAYRWMTPEQRRTVREALLELAAAEFAFSFDRSFRFFWVRNWNAMGISALGHAALAIQGETLAPGHDYLYTAKRLAEEYFNNAIGRDGGFVEGTHYLYYGVQHLLVFAAALAHSTEYDLFESTNLKRLPDYLPYCFMPWSQELDPIGYARPNIPLNMHVTSILRDRFPGKATDYLWRSCYGDEPYQWLNMHYYMLLWYRPEPEARPLGLPLARHFRDRGIVKMRSGWDADAVAASFEAEWGRVAAHDQADRGNFTIQAYGARLCVDAGGRHSPTTGATRAHNLVTVDGKGQPLFYINSMSDAFITDYGHLPGIATSAEADLTNAYCYGHSWFLTRKDVDQFRHVRRRFTMVRASGSAPPYFLVTDDIDKDGQPHEYTWHLHSFGMNDAKLDPDGSFVVSKNWPKEVSYLVHPMPDRARPGPVGQGKYGRAEFEIDVPADGEYMLWGLGRAGDECPGGMDSWFLSLAGRKGIYWSGGHSVFHKWLAVPGTFRLTRGKHTLQVRMREPEAKLVRFYLTSHMDEAPVGWRPKSGAGRMVIDASKPTRLVAPMTVREESIVSTPATMRAVPLWPREGSAKLGTFAPDVTCTQHLYTLSARATQARFAVLIYPRRPGMPKLDLTRRGRAFELKWADTVDRVLLRTDRPIDAGGVESDADLVVLRGSVDFMMAGGSKLTVNGQTLVDLAGAKGTVMVHSDWVAVSGEKVRTFRVRAPRAKHVSAFGRPVEFRTADGFVVPAGGTVKPPTVLRWN